MTAQQLKKKIKSKFGTISRFCRIAGLDRYEIQKFFAATAKKMTPEREAYIRKLNEMVLLTSNKGNSNYEITATLRKKIKKAIEDKGGVINFCSDNQEFSQFSIWQIMSGKRKRRTKKVNQLINKLNIK